MGENFIRTHENNLQLGELVEQLQHTQQAKQTQSRDPLASPLLGHEASAHDREIENVPCKDAGFRLTSLNVHSVEVLPRLEATADHLQDDLYNEGHLRQQEGGSGLKSHASTCANATADAVDFVFG